MMRIKSLSSRTLALVAAAVGGVILLGSTCNLTNKAPSVPVISGPSAAVVGVPVTFKATATDPDGDSVAFQFDWGDTTTPVWSSYVVSGDTLAQAHPYADSGPYSIKAKAKDLKGRVTSWSDGLALSLISAGPAYPDSVCDSIYLGTGGTSCSMSRDGSLLAVGTNSSNDSVCILRVSDRTLLSRIGVCPSVAAVVFSNDNQYAFATSLTSNAVYRVDIANKRVVDTLPGIGSGHRLLLTPDGERLLVGASQYVFAVQTDSLTVLDSVRLPCSVEYMALNQAGTTLYVGVLHGLCAVDVPGCSLLAYTQAVDIPIHVVLSSDDESLYAYSPNDSAVVVLRASDLTVTRRVNIGTPAAYHMLRTPDGAYLYIAWEVTRIYDTRTLLPVDSMALSGWGELVVHPSGDSAYYAGRSRLFFIGKRR